MRETVNQLSRLYELLVAFTIKEIKARYKSAFLGFLWLFLNPIIQMVVMGFVFSIIFRFGLKDYYLFLFVGLLPWNFFSISLNKATTSFVYERDLIQKSTFQREVIPLSIVLSNFFHLIISLLLFLIFLALIGKWQIFSLNHLLLLIISLFSILTFTAGLSLITSSLNVYWRDVNFFTQALLLIWFYATPVLYPLSLIPNHLRIFFYFNPLLGIFTTLQKIIIGSENLPYKILCIQFFITIFTLVIGIIIFKKKSKYFSDWL
jgi:ABC-2 type transport system permease protein